MSGMHRCGESCADFYPLQTCSNICGVVVIIVAAISCRNYEFFQHISTTHGNNTTFPPVFLQTPTKFGKYLRLVVASWIACDSINVEYIIPQFWKQQQGQLSSSCSTTFTVPDHASHNTKNVECNNKGKNPENISTPSKKDNHCTAPVVIIDDNDDTSSPSTHDMHDDDIFVPVPKKEKHIKCSDCNLMFARKFTLKRHMRTKHKQEEPNGSNCICHECGFKCHKIAELRKHLSRKHNILLTSEQIILENMNGEFNVLNIFAEYLINYFFMRQRRIPSLLCT
jgi:hypothetical protein